MRGMYTGELVDGIRQGRGLLVFANGDKYDGEFVGGFRQGHGVFTSERGARVYDGEWRRSARHGHGKEKWRHNGDRYEGQYVSDLFHGKGVLVRGGSGSRYDGEFVNGRRHGYGCMKFRVHAPKDTTEWTTNPNKPGTTGALASKTSAANTCTTAVYVGHWREGRMHGEGMYTRGDGSFYDGTWLDGLAHGLGKEVAVNTGEVFEGNWKQGQRHGEGAVTRLGKKRNGVWEMGARVKWTSAEIPVGGVTLAAATATAKTIK